MKAETTDRLVAHLVASHRPSPPLRSPFLRSTAWLALALVLVGGIVLSHGLRSDLGMQFARPVMLMEWLSALLTGVLAALATFLVSIPGRSPRWALLPLPALALWLGTLSVGCLADYFQRGATALQLQVSYSCVLAIVMTSVPLGVTLLVMVRHAGIVRPLPTAICGGLAVAALSAAGLSLFHHVDTALMLLVWHLGSVAFVTLLAATCARRLFAWIGLVRI